MHANYDLLTVLLREDLNFQGVAVSDWQDIEKLNFYHHIAATMEDVLFLFCVQFLLIFSTGSEYWNYSRTGHVHGNIWYIIWDFCTNNIIGTFGLLFPAIFISASN